MCVFNVSTEAKQRVLEQKEHQIVVDDKRVIISLEPTENSLEKNGMSQVQTQSQEGARSGEKHPNEEHSPNSVDSCVQKVSIERRYVCICHFLSSHHILHYCLTTIG